MPYYTIKNAFFHGMGFPFSRAIEAEAASCSDNTPLYANTTFRNTQKILTFFSEYEIRKEQIAGNGVQLKHGCTNQNRNPQDMLKERTCQKIKGCNEQNLRNLCQCNRFILLNLHGPKHVLKAVFGTNMAKKLLFS